MRPTLSKPLKTSRETFAEDQLRKAIAHLFAQLMDTGSALPSPKENLAIQNAWNAVPNEMADFPPWRAEKSFGFAPGSSIGSNIIETALTFSDIIDATIAAVESSEIGPGNQSVESLPDLPQDLDDFNPFNEPGIHPLIYSPGDEIYIPPATNHRPTAAPSVDVNADSLTNDRSSDLAFLRAFPELTPNVMKIAAYGMEVLLRYGVKEAVKKILDRGVVYDDTVPGAIAARAIFNECNDRSLHKAAKDFQESLRFSAINLFRDHWKFNFKTGVYFSDSSNGVHLAGFLGVLFTVNMISREDIHLGLHLLIDGSPSLNRLSAVRALIIQSGRKLCDEESAPYLVQIRDKISARSTTGELIWGGSVRKDWLIADTISTIDRFFKTRAVPGYVSSHPISTNPGNGQQDRVGKRRHGKLTKGPTVY